MRAPTASPDLFSSLTDDVVASGSETVSVPTPSTGEPLHELPRSSADDVRDAVARARLAQLAWARAGFAERRRVLLRAHDLILDRGDQLLDLVQLESGKTRGQAFEEVYQAAGVTRYNALTARRVLGGRRERSGVPTITTTRVRYRPKGVAGIITPWNYALALAAMDVIPALAAGCAVVQKADDQGALTILALRRAFIDAGVPEAVWAVVAGPSSEVGEALTDEVDYICFTGSTATGRKIGEKAGRRLVGASLELGGKNAMIVLDDVDPERAAADAAYACFSAMGQLCVSIERIYVHRKVAAPFTRALVERLADARLGSSLDYTSDFGSLATAAQLERIQGHLDDALAKGATVLVGGRARPEVGPWFFEPTVLTGVTADMRVHAEETFGASRAAHRRGPRGRQRQHQRGLPRHLRLGRCADGRREVLWARAPQRSRRPPAIRRPRHHLGVDRAPATPPHRSRVLDARGPVPVAGPRPASPWPSLIRRPTGRARLQVDSDFRWPRCRTVPAPLPRGPRACACAADRRSSR